MEASTENFATNEAMEKKYRLWQMPRGPVYNTDAEFPLYSIK